MFKALKSGIFILILLISAQAFAAAEHPWELKKDEGGIEVYIRKVEGSPILEYKAEMTVDMPLEKVRAFYEREDMMPQWFHQCIESELLEKKSGDDKILYFALDMPWPVSDRDSIYRRVRSEDPATGAVTYALSAEPDNHPHKDGRVRITYIKSQWRFTPLENGRTEVYYQSHSDAGGSLPKVLVNKLAVNIPFHTFENLRKILKEKA